MRKERSELERLKRKTRKGTVVSDKMEKTIVVEIQRTYAHPFYGKVVRMTNKLKAHDEKNEGKVGDLVEIMETRPISKNKRWRLVKILGKSKVRGKDLPKPIRKAEDLVPKDVGPREEKAESEGEQK